MITPETPDIPPNAYATYNLLFNNTTYRAVRQALEQIATYGQIHDSESNDAFINEIMNHLTDASLERCGATYHPSKETTLMDLLSPLDIYISDLAQLHLDNFGRAPQASSPPTSELLQITRAELHGMQRNLQHETTANSQIAAQYLHAAALLTGAAGDLIHNTKDLLATYHHQNGASAKLLAAFEALDQAFDITLAEARPLPNGLEDLLARSLQRLSLSHSDNRAATKE